MARYPRITFTPEQIRQASILIGLGMTYEKTALVIGVGYKLFEKRISEAKKAYNEGDTDPNNFYTIIENARTKSEAKLMQTAYQVAVDDKNVTMLIFLCKTRLGWREKDPLQDSEDKKGADTTPTFEVQINRDGKFVTSKPRLIPNK